MYLLKTVILVLLMALLPNGNVSSQETQRNLFDAEGQKTGYWAIFSPEDFSIMEEGSYVDGKKDGLWKTYFPNGNVSHEITWRNGVARGSVRSYYPDGKLREEGNWQEFCWVGTYRYYHPTGQSAYEFHFNRNGRREGEQRYFYPDGVLKYRGKWDNGAILGQVEVYNATGDLVQLRNYNDSGEFESLTTNNDALKQFIAETTRPQSSPFLGTGHHTIYRMNGQIYQKGYYQNGQFITGEEFIYDDQENLRQIRVYENGRMVRIKSGEELNRAIR